MLADIILIPIFRGIRLKNSIFEHGSMRSKGIQKLHGKIIYKFILNIIYMYFFFCRYRNVIVHCSHGTYTIWKCDNTTMFSCTNIQMITCVDGIKTGPIDLRIFCETPNVTPIAETALVKNIDKILL